MNTVDLRSDYFRLATPAMRDAMSAALATATGFNMRDDPFVRELESLAASILHKEDALFLPTCSMANQTALQLFCRRGDGFLAEATSHVVVAEAGAPAALSGATALPIVAPGGRLTVDAVGRMIDDSAYDVPPRLLVLENTHTRHGGIPMDVEATRELSALAHRSRIAVHLDGARLFNACLALGCEPHELAAAADTVSLSLNKGLGAPIGAVLAGPRDVIGDAVRVRARVGGNWRGAGIPAAAAAAALRGGFRHMAADHANAARLAAALRDCPMLVVVPAEPRTNIVLIDVDPHGPLAKDWIASLADQGVLALARGRRRIRLVLHGGIGADDVDSAVEAFRRVASRLSHPSRG